MRRLSTRSPPATPIPRRATLIAALAALCAAAIPTGASADPSWGTLALTGTSAICSGFTRDACWNTPLRYAVDANGNVAAVPSAEGFNCTNSLMGLATATNPTTNVVTYNMYRMGSAARWAVATVDPNAGTSRVSSGASVRSRHGADCDTPLHLTGCGLRNMCLQVVVNGSCTINFKLGPSNFGDIGYVVRSRARIGAITTGSCDVI